MGSARVEFAPRRGGRGPSAPAAQPGSPYLRVSLPSDQHHAGHERSGAAGDVERRRPTGEHRSTAYGGGASEERETTDTLWLRARSPPPAEGGRYQREAREQEDGAGHGEGAHVRRRLRIDTASRS